ncbi:hypothetical protein C9I57_29360 [Trinickia symbiotica]|uniref:Uncharacterized protein n=1 Tax=Trinickia symbiotica TaxID=863227 RepID=A0A2T3XKY0_9BURK|nr:hypothetical protein [Trinickia symbiotica]PTB17184.1 hypothetical protein C9I57_29360 [Trinickia symbiotica]
MPHSVAEIHCWRALRARNEARLIRARQSVAAAARASAAALASLDAARAAFEQAAHEASKRRHEIERGMRARYDFLQRADLYRATDAYASLERMRDAARAKLADARTAHDDACRTLEDARARLTPLLRRREKYRLALSRLRIGASS